MLSIQTIKEASRYLSPKIIRTPVEFSPALSELLRVDVYLKLEFLQRTGSFKYRGGLYAISQLSEENKKKGVATCSAGNHGLALSSAAIAQNIPCTVFVPLNIDPAKMEKLKNMGAHEECSPYPGYDDTMRWSLEIIRQKGLYFISPFDNEEVMTANGGTIANEVLEDLPDAENFILPFGGGGLTAGFAFYAKTKKPHCKVIACQHEGSAGLKLSLKTGKAATEMPPCDTLAGPIEGGIGAQCFEYVKDRIDHAALVSEKEIFSAFRWMLKHHQYLIEPASTAPIAACLKNDLPPLTGATVLVLTGRNVSLEAIRKMLA